MEDGGSSPSIPQELMDSVLCVPGSRIVASGLKSADISEKIVMFVNAGGGGEAGVGVKPDGSFQGGNVISTGEIIWDGGEFPAIYQTARFGNCGYRFKALPPGDYVVDLHFAEIVNSNGPKGMRVFDVFIQDEKVVSELDVYGIVGANKPLVVVDIGVSVGEDGDLGVRFEGVVGTPIVNGICIRQAAEGSSTTSLVNHEHLTCNNCTAEVMIPRDQGMRMKSLVKYEEQIKDLKAQCQLKADECHQAWMSLTATTRELEQARMELDNKFVQNMSLDQEMKKQTEALNEISTRHERDKIVWATAIVELEKKVKIMKEKQSDLSSEAHECASSIPDLNKMIVAVQTLVAQYDELKLKFNEEQMKRKELHNQLQEAKGNIRVFCRCRPFRKEEESARHQTVVDFNAVKDGDLGIITGGSTKKMFKFDRVFTPQDDQVEVFVDASPLVLSVLDGYNVCIFAYGQTGTGKTFTMEGPQQNRGVNYRTLQQLFKTIAERKETTTYEISVSVLEVYNEQIRDLLATSSATKKLEVKQMSEGVNHVPGIVEARVGNVNEAWDVLQAGSNARAVGSNNVNERSSRSHCLLCTLVRAKNLITGECTVSKLWLVDLAGSERLTKTEVQGERLKEAQNINRSLSALGDVISALANKSSHIPYRNSKLTHLLQDSLGGDSKTLMFVQISPSEHDLGETLSSLNFATRVRGVELGPVRKQTDIAELQKLKAMLDKAKHDLKYKDDMMRKLEDNVQNLESKASSKDQLCKNQHDKVNELEVQLASKTELCRKLEKQLCVKDQLCKNQHDKVNELEVQLASKTELCKKLEKQVEQLSDGIKGREETYSSFQHKVKQLENKLKEYDQIDVRGLQSQVKQLENKLKEYEQIDVQGLQSQVKELQNREKEIAQELESRMRERTEELTRERQNSGSYQQKMKALEERLKQYEQLGESSFGRPQSTPMTTSSPMIETVCQMDPLSTRSLNSSSCDRAAGQLEKSILLKGPEPLRELRRKRDSQGKAGGGTENSFPLPGGSLHERKAVSADQSDKARQLDPSKAYARITRSTKPAAGQAAQKAAACPGSVAGSRSYRGDHHHQVSGIREINKKQKVWLR